MLDAALNPYLTGAFVLSLGTKSIEIEEAYASVIRGLPLNLGLKAGKYRLGFGRLNPMHPHAYPFISTPRVMDPGSLNCFLVTRASTMLRCRRRR